VKRVATQLTFPCSHCGKPMPIAPCHIGSRAFVTCECPHCYGKNGVTIRVQPIGARSAAEIAE
jgi:hypothetical protein